MSDNHIIITTCQNMCARTKSFRSITLRRKKCFDNSLEKRTKIIDYILDGKEDAAIDSLTKHLALAKETIQNYMGKNTVPENSENAVIY